MTVTTQNPDDFLRQLTELDKIHATCKALSQTKHYQNFKEEGILAVLARAKTLKIDPFEALNSGFYIVQGKVGMTTEMMAALVRKQGHSIQKDPKSNNELCILHGKRKDNGDIWTCTFSKSDAEAAGLWGGPTWRKYPGIMLYNRCMSMLFRQLFPDIALGAGYVPDEIDEIQKTGDYAQSLPESPFEVINPYPQEAAKKTPSVDDIKILKKVFENCPEVVEKAMNKKLEDMGLMSFSELSMEEFNNILDFSRSKIIMKDVLEKAVE